MFLQGVHVDFNEYWTWYLKYIQSTRSECDMVFLATEYRRRRQSVAPSRRCDKTLHWFRLEMADISNRSVIHFQKVSLKPEMDNR